MKTIAILAFAACVACGGPGSKGAEPAGGTSTHLGTSDAAEKDAGAHAPRACVRDSKDPMPCSEECDRGIATSCVILAGRVHAMYAVTLFERACELRDAPSCVSAARFHANGHGVPPNRAKQMDLLAKACLLGHTEACSTPAKAFATGSGVTRDERRATELRERACAGGVESACEALTDGGL